MRIKVFSIVLLMFLLFPLTMADYKQNQINILNSAEEIEEEPYVEEFKGNAFVRGNFIYNNSFASQSIPFTTHSITKFDKRGLDVPEYANITISNLKNHGIGNGIDIRQDRNIIGGKDRPLIGNENLQLKEGLYYPIFVPKDQIIELDLIRFLCLSGQFDDTISIHNSELYGIGTPYPRPSETAIATYTALTIQSLEKDYITLTSTGNPQVDDWYSHEITDPYQLTDQPISGAYIIDELLVDTIELNITDKAISLDYADAGVKVLSDTIGIFYIKVLGDTVVIPAFPFAYSDRILSATFTTYNPYERTLSPYYEILSFDTETEITAVDAGLKIDGKTPTNLGEGIYNWIVGETSGYLGTRFRGVFTSNYKIISFDISEESKIMWANWTRFDVSYVGNNMESFVLNITDTIELEDIDGMTNPYIRLRSKNSEIQSLKLDNELIEDYVQSNDIIFKIDIGELEAILLTPNNLNILSLSSGQSIYRKLDYGLSESTFYTWVELLETYNGKINIIWLYNNEISSNQTFDLNGIKVSGPTSNVEAGDYSTSVRIVKNEFDFSWFYGYMNYQVLNKTSISASVVEYKSNFTKGDILEFSLYFSYTRLTEPVLPLLINYTIQSSETIYNSENKKIIIDTTNLNSGNYTIEITAYSPYHEPKTYEVVLYLEELKSNNNLIFIIVYSVALLGLGIFGYLKLKK